jgi:lysine/ornithine N-monooxygenase
MSGCGSPADKEGNMPSQTTTTSVPRPRGADRKPSRSKAVVIGAGPYGLSVAAHLAGLGVQARVFGDPMATWRRHMPEGMFLKSTPSASSISAPGPGFTLMDFCDHVGTPRLHEDQPVPIDLFERYGLWFQKQLVPWVEPHHVCQVIPAGGGFRVVLESGEDMAADAVVVATGLMSYAHTPRELASIGAVTHSSQHRQPAGFAGREVAIVGAGQSALETAALLHESGAQVRVLARGNRVLFARPPGPSSLIHQVLKPASPMGPGWSLFGLHRGAALFRHLPLDARLRTVRSVLGPSGAWWLRERVVGLIDVRTEHQVRTAWVEGSQTVLHLREADRRSYELPVDHVIAATGYRVDVAALNFLAPSLRDGLTRAGGSPHLSAGFESSTPGLFFVGLASAATFGPLLRFVCGTEFAGPCVSSAVAARIRSHLHGR